MEKDLTQYWLELLTESGAAKDAATKLHRESSKLLAVFFASIGKKLKE
jgi:hypothetical protein